VKAIGYVRWSTDDQSSGNSLERQTANVAAYCERNGLELADTLVDDGFSAFKGEHLSKGKLGKFLTAADKGKHKGCALVIEALDRLSRQGITETGDLLKRILKNGIEVHVTQTNRVIRSLDDITTALLNVLESWTAEEYSKKLRERVGSAWRSKKHNGPDGISITGQLPAWLSGKTGEQIRVNEERAEIVREIFRLAATGLGKRMIARILNERGIPPFRGKTWGHSYIGKLLHSRTPLGEFRPCKNGKPDGDVRPNFFPSIVDPALYQKAREALVSRRTIADDGTVTGKYQGRTGKINNLFTGLVWDCTNRDAPVTMYYENRGKRSKPRLAVEKTNSDRPNAFDYALFEGWFLTFLDQIDWTTVLGETDSEGLRHAEEAVARLALDIERGEQQVQKLTDLLLDTPSKALKDRLLKTEAQIEKNKADKETAEKHLEQLRRKHHDLLDKSVIYGKLAESHDLTTRARLREEIRRKVDRINFAFHQAGMQRNDTTLVAVRFVNGAVKVLLFLANGVVMAGSYDNPTSWVTLKGSKVIRRPGQRPDPEVYNAVKAYYNGR
jgi:DNA invertase Pin-like site-specific DNA recombinase